MDVSQYLSIWDNNLPDAIKRDCVVFLQSEVIRLDALLEEAKRREMFYENQLGSAQRINSDRKF